MKPPTLVSLPSHTARYELALLIKPDPSCVLGASDFSRVFMGHMETSKPSSSDPALSHPIRELADLPLTPMPLDLLEATSGETPQRLLEQSCSSSRRARMKDMCWGSGDSVVPKPAASPQ